MAMSLAFDLERDASRRMARGMENLQLNFSHFHHIALVEEPRRFRRLLHLGPEMDGHGAHLPEHFLLQRVDVNAGAGGFGQGLVPADVVEMRMSVDDHFAFQAVLGKRVQDVGNIPARVDDHGLFALLIPDDVAIDQQRAGLKIFENHVYPLCLHIANLS